MSLSAKLKPYPRPLNNMVSKTNSTEIMEMPCKIIKQRKCLKVETVSTFSKLKAETVSTFSKVETLYLFY